MSTKDSLPSFNKVDLLLEIFSWAFTMGIVIYTLIAYSKLPDRIPTHFNGAGQVDGYGSPGTVFFLVAVLLVLQLGLTILAIFPQVYNYPVRITDENRVSQYRMATYLIRTLKLILVILFSYIQYSTISTALNGKGGLTFWFMPITLVVLFGTVAMYIANAFKHR